LVPAHDRDRRVGAGAEADVTAAARQERAYAANAAEPGERRIARVGPAAGLDERAKLVRLAAAERAARDVSRVRLAPGKAVRAEDRLARGAGLVPRAVVGGARIVEGDVGDAGVASGGALLAASCRARRDAEDGEGRGSENETPCAEHATRVYAG